MVDALLVQERWAQAGPLVDALVRGAWERRARCGTAGGGAGGLLRRGESVAEGSCGGLGEGGPGGGLLDELLLARGGRPVDSQAGGGTGTPPTSAVVAARGGGGAVDDAPPGRRLVTPVHAHAAAAIGCSGGSR